ncbi:MAG: TetR/AcrR family transcriptional regulator [Solirubrobacteraceae bacterium]|nr:TetR/AcrR family transcriptional regulator [Solirubrobacteraceae bacterium]
MSTRQERQQATREALLDAAERTFSERGYHSVTVPEIAKEAGFTTGAVYSNFSGKEELFLALMERAMGGEAERRAEAIAAAQTPQERVRLVARLWIDVLHERPEAMTLFMEFWSYSRRDPALREEVARRLAETRGGLGALIAMADPDAPSAAIAEAGYALAHGFALHHLADPEGVPIERLEQALLWVFEGAGVSLGST